MSSHDFADIMIFRFRFRSFRAKARLLFVYFRAKKWLLFIYVYISGAVNGTGVYFARDASYSLDYTVGDRKVIYFTRVRVGRYCEGRSKFKKPPPINSEQPEILFNSMVLDMKISSIFVTYYDN